MMTSQDATQAACGTCGFDPADGPDGNCTSCRGEWAVRNLPDEPARCHWCDQIGHGVADCPHV